MLEISIIVILSSFIARTLAHMVNYSLTYGQLFGFVKLWIARKVFKDIDSMFTSANQSENEATSYQVYDIVCNAKQISRDKRQFFWSYVFSLLDCVYCLGFWISVATTIVVWQSYPEWPVLTIPIFTYFLIEKL